MCGITGYVGHRPAVDAAVGNLRRLEYRGYDSAGVAYPTADGIEVVRSVGAVSGLAARLCTASHAAGAAIAHTRWATHGRPDEVNAHPHTDCTGRIAVVHNGIIENHAAIRRHLIAAGHALSSQTDTEVIPHLIEQRLGPGPASEDRLVAAVCAAIEELEGSFALAVMAADLPDALIVARRDSPLVIGLGENENLIASDISAVMSGARRVIVLQDGDCAVVRARSVRLFGVDGAARTREPLDITWDEQAAEKGGFAHFMLKEIHDEPRTIRQTLRGRISSDGRVTLPELDALGARWATTGRITLVGCGTAHHAGLVAKRLLEQLLRRPVEATVASEFRYGDPIIDRESLVILISQSGETADTLAALREARRLGASTLAVVNAVGSTLAREADAALLTQAGPEIGVASTKAYLAQIAALALLAIHLAQHAELADRERSRLVRGLQQLPEQIQEIIDGAPSIEALARALANHHSFFFLGRSYDNAAAAEAALKLKEISYIHAEAYPAGEMKHGPLALVEPGVAVIGLATQPATHEKMVSNLQEIKAREGTVVAVTCEGETPPECADYRITVPGAPAPLMPALTLVALQLLAYHIARLRGCSIDQPRNLAKSVTVE